MTKEEFKKLKINDFVRIVNILKDVKIKTNRFRVIEKYHSGVILDKIYIYKNKSFDKIGSFNIEKLPDRKQKLNRILNGK